MINTIIESLDKNWYDWELTEFTLNNHKLNILIWIANGKGSYGLYYPTKRNFGFWGNIKFHKAYKKWLKIYYEKKHKLRNYIESEEIIERRIK